MKKTSLTPLPIALCCLAVPAAGQPAATAPTVRLVVLDPGHFHAGLVQKIMYPQVDPTVHVYAPEGDELAGYLKLISGYNARAENPTHWQEKVYIGPDYLARMLREKAGNVLVLAGNNRRKTEYIQAGVEAGLNVLADKPMAIDSANFKRLEQAFAAAQRRGVLLYDIMTERSEVTVELQREFSMMPDVFGKLEAGTPERPGVTMESVHYFYKSVSGSILKRPAWAFDVTQQGEGILDVSTHLVDLVQWEGFPGQSLDYRKDIRMLSARRWPTMISKAEFNAVTALPDFPDYLKGDVKDGMLSVYANGEMSYRIRGVHAKVSTRWDYRAPDGAGDSLYSIMRGTRCDLVIRQGAEQAYKPVLYVEPAAGADAGAFGKALEAAVGRLQANHPGVSVKPGAGGWEVVVPPKYDVGHEAHFGQVMERFLRYLAAGKLPEWEVPNMIAKYYTTTAALELARQSR